jgi:(E)-4-hydroxy-3-methylbut-2-enyl-diphosphate synthase
MSDINKFYCNSLTNYSRLKTRKVTIGAVPLGGSNPIRIQSMTTTDTMDTIATVEQTIRMVEAGCEYVRITAPSMNEAQNLAEIKKELKLRGYDVPLIADIHFTPNAAELAARIVEKVRVNPGNYADKKRFETIEYNDYEYEAEMERIRKRFTPLVNICKEYGTAMRIGTNHGSLSDRIMSRYGDTPLGMVESALEFLRICEDLNYYSIVLSMKASNPKVMVQAYRLLINKMKEAGMNYPLHLGVTEAGGGEDGRIKSSVGIGTLLEDGIGDTVRVSLTEDPEFEAPVAIALVNRYSHRKNHEGLIESNDSPIDPFNYKRRESFELLGLGGGNVPRVIADYSKINISGPDAFENIGYSYNAGTDKWNLSDMAADFIYLGEQIINFALPGSVKLIYDSEIWANAANKTAGFPLFELSDYLNEKEKSPLFNFVKLALKDVNPDSLKAIKNDSKAILVIESSSVNGMTELRQIFFELTKNEIKNPVIIKRDCKELDFESLRLYSATDFGGLLIDGFGDGVWVGIDEAQTGFSADINRSLFGILQAARTRVSKTEYIACPSCGRTQFDLQKTTEMIRQRTGRLKGVKIAIMGCIVNGPGEMADADYGYVGSGNGKITLYRGKVVVKKSIPSANAVDELIDLIKEDGVWAGEE